MTEPDSNPKRPVRKLPDEAFVSGTTRRFATGVKTHNQIRPIAKLAHVVIRNLRSASNLQELQRLEPSLHRVTHQKRITQEWAIKIDGQYRLCFDWDKTSDCPPSKIQITKHYAPI